MVLIGVFTFLENSHRYFMKNFFESDTFQSEYYDFTERLGSLILNPLDATEAKKEINVTKNEIEDYRTYYGGLSEQLNNINDQYTDKINEAKMSKATSVEKALIAERDKKIKDITRNFEDDEYVRDKIIKIKTREIDEYVNNLESEKQDFLNNYDYYAFKLTDVSTGQTFTAGNLNDTAVYTHKYVRKQNTLNALTVGDSTGDDWNSTQEVTSENNVISYDIGNIIQNSEHQYEGEIRISKTAFQNSAYYQKYKNFKFHQRLLFMIWIFSLLSIIAVFFNRPFFKVNESHFLLRAVRKWSIDVRVVCLIMSIFGVFFNLLFLSDQLISFSLDFNFVMVVAIDCILLYLFVWLTVMQLLLLIQDMNTEEKRIKAYQKSTCLNIVQDIRNLFLSMSIGLQSIALLSIVFLSGVGIVGAVLFGSASLLLIYFFLFFTIALPAIIIFLRRIGYLNKIMKQTEEIAEGRLNSEIKVRGKSDFAKHASHLNRLREGVRTSLSEQAKSERLKTELITNVSHDLRTPLTSIITYTDLLKNPNITEDERNSYIAILDKKSQRLKTLIEDLFEVSKMASGNIELQRQKVNLNQLLQQALGEHEVDMEKADMEFRIHITDEILVAYLDGQKWWRVLDNLIINALKYTMEGTRVYISLDKVDQNAQFVIKNITRYELGDQNIEELYERFKRADTSRHTEGSGLGLAIAQSIVDLHNGSLDITVDGDLFKVVVNVPLVH